MTKDTVSFIEIWLCAAVCFATVAVVSGDVPAYCSVMQATLLAVMILSGVRSLVNWGATK